MEWNRGTPVSPSELSKKLRTICTATADAYGYRLTVKGSVPFQCGIPSGRIKDFWNMYLSGELSENKYVLLEEVGESTNVVCDFVLTYTNDQDDPFPDSGAFAIMRCFHDLQSDHYIGTPDNAERYCVVQTTDQYDVRGTSNIYVRFQFPYWRVSRNEINTFIRPHIINMLAEMGAVKEFPNGLMPDWEKSFQPFLYHVSLYGQPPNVDVPHFSTLEIYEPIPDEDNYFAESVPLEEVFSIHHHGHVIDTTLPAGCCEGMDVHDLYPLFLSTRYHASLLMRKGDPSSPHNVTTEYVDVSMENALEMCKIFLPLVSPHRWHDEVYWKIIGECIYNSCRGSAAGLTLWSQATYSVPFAPFFSRLGDIEATCSSAYYGFHTTYHTVRTLAWWVRLENPKLYKEWHMRWVAYGRDEAMDKSDFGIATMIYRNFWLDYAYDEDNNMWYEYDEGRWRGSKKCAKLTHAMSTKIAPQFAEKLSEYLATNPESVLEDGKKGRNKSNATKCLELIVLMLRSHRSKRNFLDEACGFFVIPNFTANLNKQKNIIGVMNGTIELRSEGHRFRPTIPEDYVTMCFTVPYEVMNYQSYRVREVLHWTCRMYPLEELHRYMWKFFGSVLQAGNPEKIFPVFTGDGNNSKSMLMEILALIMGARLVKMPVALLTESQRNTNSTSATPALSRMADALLALTEECESNIELKAAIIKKYTGGDRFYTRKLNENGGDIQLTAKFGLVCNNVPIVANADQPVRNRLRILPHLSTWAKDAPASEEDQWKYRIFPMDPNFSARLEPMASAFLWLMCQGYDMYRAEGLKEPAIITEYTNKYWLTNDFYATYIDENVEAMKNADKTPDFNYSVEVSVLYKNFRDWFVGFRAGVALPDRNTFVTEMSKKWNKPIESKWYAIRLRQTQQQQQYPQDASQSNSFGDAGKQTVPSYVPQMQLPTAPRQAHL
jgi:phage/plasmid-associated DNA primase